MSLKVVVKFKINAQIKRITEFLKELLALALASVSNSFISI